MLGEVPKPLDFFTNRPNCWLAHHALQSLKCSKNLSFFALDEATGNHPADSRAAIQIEAEAWARLLSIPGMTVASAAAITKVNEATVAKWASRVAKSVPTGAGR